MLTNDSLQEQQIHEQDLQRLRGFRLIDDDFMTAFFKDNPEDTEYMLRIIMNKEDLNVTHISVQESMKNLYGRSATLDIRATDSEHKEYDIEVQRADSGAGFKRARHNSSLLDSSLLKPGHDPEELPETYVIFITENDVIGENESIYFINRYIKIGNRYISINDGAHTIYVNGARREGSTDLERLMHDFFCTQPKDLYHQKFAEKMRYLKEDEKGVAAMCKAMEDMRNEAARNNSIDIAKNLIKLNTMPIEQIADVVKLPVEVVKQLMLPGKAL